MKTRFISLFVLAIVSVGSAVHAEAGWTVEAVDVPIDCGCRLFDPYLLWTAPDDQGKRQIFVYDIATKKSKQITHEPEGCSLGRLVGQKLLYTSNGQIFLRDLSTDKTTKVHSKMGSDFFMTERRIVWLSNAANGNIFVYDIRAGSLTQVTDDSFRKAALHTDGETIVWSEQPPLPERRSFVCVYRIANGSTSKISEDPKLMDLYPMVSGDSVVFARYTGEGPAFKPVGIFVYSISRKKEKIVSDGISPVTPPGISGNLVVFDGIPATAKATHEPSQIYRYDISTAKSTKIGVGGTPQIEGKLISWHGFEGPLRGGSADAFVFDGTKVSQLRNPGHSDFVEGFGNNRILLAGHYKSDDGQTHRKWFLASKE